MKKREKGITLIALVITIIVLLILAGVTISMVLGQDSIFTKSKDATIIHKVAEIEERLKLELTDEKITEKTTVNKLNIMSNGTIEGLEEQAKATPYTIALDLMIPGVLDDLKNDGLLVVNNEGNIYEKSTGTLIASSITWLPTDVMQLYIPPKEYMPAGGETELLSSQQQTMGTVPLAIDINGMGQKGYLMQLAYDGAETMKSVSNEAFFIDKQRNIYYFDAEGNVYTSSKKYAKEGINIGSFNPDSLPEQDKKAYKGIYDGIYEFTNDKSYAKTIAEVYTNPEAKGITALLSDGFHTVTLKNQENVVAELNGTKLENLAMVILNKDGTLVGDMNKDVSYLIKYNSANPDKAYSVYKYDATKGAIIEEQGKEILGNLTIELGEGSLKDYNGYQYQERFDGNGILITKIPNNEKVDMKTDLAELNVYSVLISQSGTENVRELILPDTIKTMTPDHIHRAMVAPNDLFTGIYNNMTITKIVIPNSITKIYFKTFANCKNLKEVVMSDNIEQIARDAFTGCAGVNIKFKDGKAPIGYPWGGTNMTTSKK